MVSASWWNSFDIFFLTPQQLKFCEQLKALINDFSTELTNNSNIPFIPFLFEQFTYTDEFQSAQIK